MEDILLVILPYRAGHGFNRRVPLPTPLCKSMPKPSATFWLIFGLSSAWLVLWIAFVNSPIRSMSLDSNFSAQLLQEPPRPMNVFTGVLMTMAWCETPDSWNERFPWRQTPRQVWVWTTASDTVTRKSTGSSLECTGEVVVIRTMLRYH